MKDLNCRVFAKLSDHLKLKQKLMISYFSLILIPLMVLTFISYHQAAQTVESQVLFSAKQVFEQTNLLLSYKINKIIGTSDIIALSRNVNETLSKNPQNYSLPDQLSDMENLTAYLKSFQGNDDIALARIYLNDQFIYSKERTNLFSIREAQAQTWYPHLQKSNQKVVWITSDSENTGSSPVISVIRYIRDLNWYLKIIGVLRLDITGSSFRNILSNVNITKHSITYLQNSEGMIVTNSRQLSNDQYRPSLNLCMKLADGYTNWREVKHHGEKVLVGAKNINDSDWILVSIIPFKDILAASIKIRNQMVILMLGLGAIAYLLAYTITRSITKRIELLIQKIRKVQNADLNVKIDTTSKDEIGELTANFNYMIEKIAILIHDRYLSGQEVKNAELKALQAQINPHFLYNTLDLINWSAIKNNVPEISTLVQSLASFYKLSLSKGQDTVPFADEIEHVKLYVDIQNRRFDDKIQLIFDIYEQLYNYRILKIILQPLVENSILHGIMEKESKSGIITISGRLMDSLIFLKIQDDGIGIPDEMLSKMLTGNISNESQGYGVRNINQRIKLFYGSQYGLSYQSKLNHGTIVTITLPALKDE